jgi:hypothetical protein
MTVTIQSIGREQWQKLAPTFYDNNYRQLWDFGVACAHRVGAMSEHVAIFDKDQVIGLADVRIKTIPFTGKGIAYINGGPLVRSDPEGDPRVLKTVLSELVSEFVNRRKLVLRIQPPLGTDLGHAQQKIVFEELGFLIMAEGRIYRTIVLDLSSPLDCLRKQLDQKWRNCLNNAEKRGLSIKTGSDDSFFVDFIQLFDGMINRKDFDVDLVPGFYRQVQHDLPDNDKFKVTIVYENDQPITGHVCSILGDTCMYLLGASNESGLKNKASYLVQWSVVQKAKQMGCRIYDLGGIDPEGNPGVYHFKKGMGGADVTIPGPYEIYPSTWSKFVVSMSERVYRRIKKMRKSQ